MESVLDYEPPKNPVTLPGARLSLALLLAINLLNYIDRFVLAAVEENIRGTFGINKTQSGYFATAFIVSYMVLAPVLGWLADRTSRWVLIGASVLVWSAATAASGLAGSFVVMLITRAFVGVGEAGYGPAAPTIISDLYPLKRRGSVLAWFYMAIPVGSALGYVIGEKVSLHMGWRWAFYIVTIPGVLLGIWCFVMKDPPRGRADTGHTVNRLPGLSDYTQLLRNKSYVLNTAAMAAMTFAIGGMSFWMPTYLATARHLGENAKSKFGIITAGTGLVATLLGGILADLLRRRFGGAYFLVSAVGILIAAPLVVIMLHVEFPACWWVLGALLFFLFFNTGPSNTALANVVSPTVRASAFALNIFVIHAVGDAPAPPILGYLADHFGWNIAFELVAGLMLIAAALWLLGMPYLRADEEAVTNSAVRRM